MDYQSSGGMRSGNPPASTPWVWSNCETCVYDTLGCPQYFEVHGEMEGNGEVTHIHF